MAYKSTYVDESIYYTYTNQLGSIVAVTNEVDAIVAEQNFDAWGRKRNPANWSYTGVPTTPDWLYRGYTGHEHVAAFILINMNGRMYDPMTGLMLSPDNYVPMPFSPGGYNRYLYANGNPLKFVDPDGEFIFSLLLPGIGTFIDAALWGAVIGGAGYTASVAFSKGGFNNWDWGQFGKSVGIGAISGVATAGIGSAFGSVGSNGIGGEIARAYTHGFASGTISEFTGGDFMTGFASGGLSSLAGSAFMMYSKFANSSIGTYAFSGVAGGAGAALTGGNFWEGTAIGVMNAGLNHLQQNIQNKFYDAQLKKMYDVYKQSVNDYPGPSEFYNSTGGPLGEWAAREPQEFQNTCAARLSKALNYGGFEIPAGYPGTYQGGDGKYYFIRAETMKIYLSKSNVWSSPRLLKPNWVLKNAVFFQTGFTGGVTGHLDIIYRGIPAHQIYSTTTYYWH